MTEACSLLLFRREKEPRGGGVAQVNGCCRGPIPPAPLPGGKGEKLESGPAARACFWAG